MTEINKTIIYEEFYKKTGLVDPLINHLFGMSLKGFKNAIISEIHSK